MGLGESRPFKLSSAVGDNTGGDVMDSCTGGKRVMKSLSDLTGWNSSPLPFSASSFLSCVNFSSQRRASSMLWMGFEGDLTLSQSYADGRFL